MAMKLTRIVQTPMDDSDDDGLSDGDEVTNGTDPNVAEFE